MFRGSGKMMRTPPPERADPLPDQANPLPAQALSSVQALPPVQAPPPVQVLPSIQASQPVQANQRSNESHFLDPTQQSCTMCQDYDTLEMVQCDKCKAWLHFDCAGVTDEVVEGEFFCQRCKADISTASRRRSDGRSRKSKKSTSSSVRSEARKKQLALERLEEERKLREARDKEYLDKKYETLEQFSTVGSSVYSESDEEVQPHSSVSEYTTQWIENQRSRVQTTEPARVSLTIVPETDDLVDLDKEEVEKQDRNTKSFVGAQDNSEHIIDQSSSVVPKQNVGSDEKTNAPSAQPTTVTISDFVEPQITVDDNQSVGLNSTFQVNSECQGAMRKPSNPLNNWSLSHASPINSNQNQVLVISSQTDSVNPRRTSRSQTQFSTAAKATPRALTRPDGQLQFANIGVVRQNQSAARTSLHTTTSKVWINSVASHDVNPCSVLSAPAPQNQRPPATQSTKANNQNLISTLHSTTQLFGQTNTGDKRLMGTDNCLMVSANHTPQLSSYVASSGYGHLQSTSQMVQPYSLESINSRQVSSTIDVSSNNLPPYYTQSNNNVTNQQALWNGGESREQAFLQQKSDSGQQYGTGTESIVPSNQCVDPCSYQSMASNYQYYDPNYRPPISSNAVPQTSHPPVLHQSMNLNQNFTGYASSPTTSRQNITNPNPQLLNVTDAIGPVITTLTREQIAARYVVGKEDLPVFYGDVEKFPAFISAYETSTKMCGFTDGENLRRLSKSLKGVVLDFVEQQLCYPEDVPRVIDTLKTLYNRPEFIIEKLKARISKQPAPQADDLASIVKFSMNVQNICGTIRTAKLTDHLKNPSLLKELVDKLPPSLQLQWACHKQNWSVVDLNTFGAWLYELAKLASSIAGPPKVRYERNSENSKQKPKQGNGQNGFVNAQIESKTDTKPNPPSKPQKACQICKQSSCQRIKDCKKFISLNTKDRWAMVKEHELCIRCFGKHRLKTCKSKQKCNVGDCQKAHNPLLHQDEVKDVQNESKEIVKKTEPTANVNCSHQSVSRKVDIFRIVPVKLYHNGRSVSTFAYLDDGSNVTTMEDELAIELDLESSSKENLCVKWSFGKISKTELVSRRVSVQISGVRANSAVYDLHNVRTVTDLALPHQTISSEWLSSYQHFEGIPITTYENARPRILIGLQYSKLMVSQKTIEGLWTEPIVCKTRLGWVVQGPDGGNNKLLNDTYSVNICECEPNVDSGLHELVKNFFSWDDFGVRTMKGIIESEDVQRAPKILDLTTKKIDGRYETGLLWRFDDVCFPDSFPMALKRLECLERKMEKDPVLTRKMCDYIQDFVEKKYARKLTASELQQPTSRVWYLPTFPVFNPKKPDKFRVVWDAAAKVNKVSLNEMLLAGPDLLQPLPDVLRRFREKPIAIVGDMKEMFHQVRVIGPDVHSQRFLWRNGNSKARPEIFVMDVLTFGGKNSPCSAQHVKNTNAMEYKDQYPRAVEAIISNHYQDDMLETFETIDETVRITEEVKTIHQSGGFEIRNFMSNSSEVLERLGAKVENHRMNLDISNEPTIERVLGMFWNTSSDTFTFSLKFTKLDEEVINGIRRPTKREVLSAIMSIFDPLGLIAQCLVYGKILLQKIWRDGTDWDEKISDSSYECWCTWMEVLPEIEQIEIPRWYSPKLLSTNRKRIQLHIFVDASEEACAACVYCRIEDDEGVDCCLLGAKTKVAPTKPLTIPRMELQAAVLGIRLVDNISKCQRFQVSERFFWSDSQTVLGWIQSEARKYHQYVAFRIGEILENSTTNEWHWVDTKNNVADDATKWVKKPDLSSSSRWYKAPPFLYQSRENWPFGNDKSKFSTDEEARAVYLLAHLELPSNDIITATNFSKWNRLERAMAYALRFIDNLRLRKKDRLIGPFSRDEYNRARTTLFKQAQREEFLEEILIIRNNESLDIGSRKELHRSSVLRTCSPYLDDEIAHPIVSSKVSSCKSSQYAKSNQANVSHPRNEGSFKNRHPEFVSAMQKRQSQTSNTRNG